MSTPDRPEHRRDADDHESAPARPERARLRISDADRQRVADSLQVAMQEGRLTFTEVEERLTSVYAAKTYADLEPVTRDLPEALRRGSSPDPGQELQPPEADGPLRREIVTRSTATGPPASVGIMSGCDRSGGWTVPQEHTALALMGGVRLDLREARFAAEFVTIRCVAIMGGITVIVPDDPTDMVVECDGIGIMGSFGHRSGAGTGRGPHVRIVGVAFWGGVTIQRAQPGAEIE